MVLLHNVLKECPKKHEIYSKVQDHYGAIENIFYEVKHVSN